MSFIKRKKSIAIAHILSVYSYTQKCFCLFQGRSSSDVLFRNSIFHQFLCSHMCKVSEPLPTPPPSKLAKLMTYDPNTFFYMVPFFLMALRIL